MKLRILSLYFGLALFLTPVIALAKEDEETFKLEARLEGYPQSVFPPEKGGTSLTWMAMIFLAACAVAVLFKNAKRTHLD